LCTDDGNSCAGGDEQPVTLVLAHAETWAALRVDDEFTDDPEP
jgi:hypothetical protein